MNKNLVTLLVAGGVVVLVASGVVFMLSRNVAPVAPIVVQAVSSTAEAKPGPASSSGEVKTSSVFSVLAGKVVSRGVNTFTVDLGGKTVYESSIADLLGQPSANHTAFFTETGQTVFYHKGVKKTDAQRQADAEVMSAAIASGSRLDIAQQSVYQLTPASNTELKVGQTVLVTFDPTTIVDQSQPNNRVAMRVVIL